MEPGKSRRLDGIAFTMILCFSSVGCPMIFLLCIQQPYLAHIVPSSTLMSMWSIHAVWLMLVIVKSHHHFDPLAMVCLMRAWGVWGTERRW
jgi:hypothetical protein